MDSIRTKKTAASIYTMPLQNSITIEGNDSTFIFELDGVKQTITLEAGTYTQSSFVNKLNEKFLMKGIEAVASLNGKQLCLTTKKANGTASSIALKTTDCGTSSKAMFGELITTAPATATLTTPLKQNMTITAPDNVFTVQLSENGVKKNLSVTIPAGDYSRSELAEKLNEMYQGEVKVSLNASNSLTFTTKAEGRNVEIKVDNSMSGSIAKAMFGETTVTTPSIVASFDGDGHLVLTGSEMGGSYRLEVDPSQNSAFYKAKPSIKKTNPTVTEGSVNREYFELRANAPVPSSVTIADYNRNLTFTYKSPAGIKTVSLSFDEKAYTRAELQTAFQDKLDAALGTGECTVTVTGQRIKIKSSHYGNEYSMDSFSGGFYEYVMKGTAERTSSLTTSTVKGSQSVTDTFIIGRKDVVNTKTTIKEDISDKLSIDVMIDNVVHTLSMKLDPGEYSTQELVHHLQEKIDEQVKAAGLKEHMVLVGAGRSNTGIYGANDANSLNFYLNSAIDLDEGNYRIDGLKGNALFEIFYKTDGELQPAYIAGSKDLSGGVTVKAPKNEFSVDVDGVRYKYSIPDGEYTQQEFIDKLNELFSTQATGGTTASIKASLSGDCLMISYKQIGKHKISNIQGPAKALMFYEMGGRKDYSSDLQLQIGANAGQNMDLKRYSMSTLSMGINSITISGFKYAGKALDRLDKALDYLNSKRSRYGVTENRLEYVIKGNNVTAENLQSSESRDRDADMAEEMVQYSKAQILQQSATALLTQTMRQGERILGLLE